MKIPTINELGEFGEIDTTLKPPIYKIPRMPRCDASEVVPDYESRMVVDDYTLLELAIKVPMINKHNDPYQVFKGIGLCWIYIHTDFMHLKSQGNEEVKECMIKDFVNSHLAWLFTYAKREYEEEISEPKEK